jgi:hypothetical protein
MPRRGRCVRLVDEPAPCVGERHWPCPSQIERLGRTSTRESRVSTQLTRGRWPSRTTKRRPCIASGRPEQARCPLERASRSRDVAPKLHGEERNLDRTARNLDCLTSNLDCSTSNLDRTRHKLDRTVRNLDCLTSNLDRDLDRTASNLDRTRHKLDRTVRNLDRTTRNLDRTANELDCMACKLRLTTSKPGWHFLHSLSRGGALEDAAHRRVGVHASSFGRFGLESWASGGRACPRAVRGR